MEEIRRRIQEDLLDLIEGEVRTDRSIVAQYSTDASLYEVEPAGVVFPKHSRDVELLAAWSAEQHVPLIARGAGTGLAGGCLGRGIVIDFSRHMNQVLEVNSGTVRVQPGVTRERLNQILREQGRYFAPDPSNSLVTTVGGMLGVDSAGSHAVRVGSARDHVKSLECVLSGGQRLELGRETVEKSYLIAQPSVSLVDHSLEEISGPRFLPPVRNEALRLTSLTPATRRADLLERLAAILQEHEASIATHQPPLLRNCAGYMLRGVRQGQLLDLPRLLVGSEGTLALFTEATLFTTPLPAFRAAAMLMFASLDHAIQAMQLLLPLEPSACDLLDRRLLSLGRGTDPRFRELILPEAEGGLIVEFPGSSELEVRQRLSDCRRMLDANEIDYRMTRDAYTLDDVELIWSLPSKVVALLATLKGASRPLPFVEDVAVPPERLAEFMVLAQRTFQKHEVTATLYSHAASGQLHFRPILSVPVPGDGHRIEAIARDLYRHVVLVGGTISGEHGDGFSRTSFLRTQYGPLYRAFQQVKNVFDPENLLNPDKIVSNDTQLTTRHFRRVQPDDDRIAPVADGPVLPVLQLNWTREEAIDAAIRCNGCGGCRVRQEPLRMCPFVEDDSNEELTPRAKANTVRRALTLASHPELLAGASIRPVLNSCFNCKQCQLDCPSEVDIPHLIQEARAQQVAANGLTPFGRLSSRVHTYARLGARFPLIINRLLRNGLFRRLLQRTTGISARRRLPKYSNRPFLKTPRVQSELNSGTPGATRPTVVYFVDYFANYHDTELAEAFCRILEHNNFRVYVPQGQTISGMAMISVGDMINARMVAEQNVRELVEPAREGYPVLCTEPSAALCLSQEYPLLLKNDDVNVIAQQTLDAGTFLLNLHKQGKLRTDFTPLPLNVAWHTPCHVKALRRGQPLVELMELIPKLQVTEIDRGCTGMAGIWGLAEENFDQSLRIGDSLVKTMQSIDVVAGVTDCSSCRMQMEQGAAIPTIHPVKLLALAYGIMPRLAERLKIRPSGLSMS
ncbi:MAG: FAD-binding protein [Planctomyces sp.]|nr:FAD-binding protein [Planctomyces sp.]